MYISILLLQLMFLLGKNKSRSSGFQHNIEKFGILVKCQVFLAALTLEKSAFEKKTIIIYWYMNGFKMSTLNLFKLWESEVLATSF